MKMKFVLSAGPSSQGGWRMSDATWITVNYLFWVFMAVTALFTLMTIASSLKMIVNALNAMVKRGPVTITSTGATNYYTVVQKELDHE